jgi:hypothetical protein
MEATMAHGPHRPRVGELWSLTGSIVVAPAGEMITIPTGTPFTVLSRYQGTVGWESWVLFGNGIAGSVSDHCTLITRISDAAR